MKDVVETYLKTQLKPFKLVSTFKLSGVKFMGMGSRDAIHASKSLYAVAFEIKSIKKMSTPRKKLKDVMRSSVSILLFSTIFSHRKIVISFSTLL